MSLHVFARRKHNYAEVEVKDGASVAALQKAIIAELKYDIAPDLVRLFREVEGGGAAVLLDSCKKMSDQGIQEGSKVLVEVISPSLTAGNTPVSNALPLPVTFVEDCLGGEPMMVARLPLTSSVTAPFYLTPLEHNELVRFLQEPPSIAPQMLMLTGQSSPVSHELCMMFFPACYQRSILLHQASFVAQ